MALLVLFMFLLPLFPAASAGGWDGPWSPSVSEAQATSFVSYWYDMLTQNTPLSNRFNDYVNSDALDATTEAGGYYALDDHTKQYLIARLYDQILLLQGPYAASLNLLTPEERETRMDMTRTLLYTFIFDKVAWRASLTQAAAETANNVQPGPVDTTVDQLVANLTNHTPPEATAPPALPANLTPVAPGTVSSQAEFDLLQAAREIMFDGEVIPPVQVGAPDLGAQATLPAPETLYSGVVEPGVYVVAPDMGEPFTPAAPEAMSSGLVAPTGSTSFQALDPAPGLAPPEPLYTGEVVVPVGFSFPQTASDPLPDVSVGFLPEGSEVPLFVPLAAGTPDPTPQDVKELYARTKNTIDSTLYNLCGALPNGPVVCVHDVPVGQQASLDLDGDGQADVTGKYGTVLNPEFPAGFTAEFTATPVLAMYRAHVWAEFEVPLTVLRMKAGFDGRENGLSGVSTARVVIKDPAAAATRDVQGRFTLTYGSGTTVGQKFTFSVREARAVPTCPACPPDESNQLNAHLRFAKLLTSFNADFRFRWQNGDALYDVTSTLPGAMRLDANLVYNDTASSSQTRHVLALDEAPATMTFNLGRYSNGTTLAKYSGSAVVGRVAYDYTRIDNLATPNAYRHLSLVATSFPQTAELRVLPPLDLYYASDASLPRLTARSDRYAQAQDGSAVLKTRIDADAQGIPTWIHLVADTASQNANLNYDAGGSTTDVRVSYNDVDAATVANLHMASFPSHLDVALQASKRVAINADPAIGTFEGNFSTAGTAVQTLTGDYASLVKTAAGVGIGWRVGGFKGLLIDQTTSNAATIEARSTGDQRFRGYLSTDQVLATLDVSNMPDSVTVAVGGSSIAYTATQVVGTVRINASIPGRSLSLDVELQSLPTSLQLAWTTGVAGSVTYTSPGALGRLNGRLRKDNLVATLDLAGLPGRVDATYSSATPSVGIATTGGAIATMRADVLIDAGVLPAVPATGDHLALDQRAGGIGASLKLSGVREASASMASGNSQYRLVTNGGQAFTGLRFAGAQRSSLEVDALPANVAVHWRESTRSIQYDAGATSLAHVRAKHEDAATATTITLDLQSPPRVANLSWTTTSPVTLTYDASGALGSANLAYRQGTTGPALDANATALPAWFTATAAPDQLVFDARASAAAASGSASVGTVSVRYGSNGAFPANVPTVDHAVVVQTASGVSQVDFADTGVAYVKADVRSNELHAKVMNANPREFRVNVDTPTAVATATIKNVPSSVSLDVVGGTMTYAASAAIGEILVSFDNKDGVSNGLAFGLTLRALPTGFTLAWDPTAASVNLTANAPVGLVQGVLRRNGAAAGTLAGDHVSLVRDGTALGVDLQLTGFKQAGASFANGGQYSLEVSPGGQPFTAAAALNNAGVADVQAQLDLSAMPTKVIVDLRPGTRSIEYNGVAASSVRAQYSQQSTGLQAKFELTNLPAYARLDWTTGATPTFTYQASGSMGQVYGFYRLANAQTTFEATLATLPAYAQVAVATDRITFDARTSAGAAAGSASIGTVSFKYATDAQFMGGTPVEDHVVLFQNGGVTRFEVKDTGLKYANVNVANNELHAKVQYAAARVFKLSADTPTAAASATITSVPADVTVDLVPGTLTYSASEGIGQLVAAFDNKDGSLSGLAVNLDVTGIPTSFSLGWDKTGPRASLTASNPIGVVSAQVRTNGGSVSTVAGDHVLLQRAGAAFGADVRVSGVKSAVVDLANGGFYQLTLSPGGQAFAAGASIDNDVSASLNVGALPASITADLRAGNRNFSYAGGTSGTTLSAQHLKASSGQQARVDLTGLPASARVDWTTGTAARITYDASGSVARAFVGYKLANSQAAWEATVTSVPAWMQLDIVADKVVFDARTSAGAAVGSGSVGSVAARYSTDGAYLNPVAEDHAILYQATGVTKADLLVSGLRYVKADVAGDQVHLDGRLSSARLVKFSVETPTAIAWGTIDALPASLTVDYGAAGSIVYNAASAIGMVQVGFDSRGGTKLWFDVRGLPSSVTASWDTTANSVSLSAPSSVTSVYGQVWLGGGSVGTTAGDHAYVVRTGAQWAADFRIGGIRGLTANPTNGGYYQATLVGGQPFVASINLDNEHLATLSVSAMPASLTVDMKPASKSFAYAGAATGSTVSATYRRVSTGLEGVASLTGLPSSVTVSWTTGLAPTYTWDASGPLTSAYAFYREASNGAVAELAATGLAPWMKLTLAADQVVFDARTSSGAGVGSGSVGSILMKYGTGNSFLGGTPAEDHVALKQTSTTTHAELKHSGIKYVSLDSRNDQYHADVRTSAARVFKVGIETPTSIVSGVVDSVPATFTADYDGTTMKYRGATTIGRADFYIDPRDGVTGIWINLAGLPTSVDVALDFTAQTATWTANAATASAFVHGRRASSSRTWDLRVTASGIPATWSVSWSSQRPNFRSTSGIGVLDAYVTNHNSVTRPGGDHLSVVYRSSNGDLDGSFQMSSVKVMDVQKTATGYSADVQAGNRGGFTGYFDYLSTTKAYAYVSVARMPTSIQISQSDDVVSYTANANFDVSVYSEIGSPAGIQAAPEPVWRIGFSLRDGTSSGATGYRAKLWLNGAPTGVTANARARTLTLTSYAGGGTVQFDVDVKSASLNVLAEQRSIPVPITMTMGPVSASSTATTKKITASYTASAGMGEFLAWVTQGSNAGYLYVTNVPSSVSIDVTMGTPTSSASISVASGVSQVYALVKSSSTATAWDGGMWLRDVPAASGGRSVTLTYGRQEVTTSDGNNKNNVPTLTYSASASTVDASLWVNAALFGGDLKATAVLEATNLGASASASLSGTTFTMTSSPATQSIEMHVWASYKWIRSWDTRCAASCAWARVETWGSYGVDPVEVKDVRMKFTGLSSTTITLGLMSSVDGTFTSAEFGWNSLSIRFTATATAELVVDFGWVGAGTVRIRIVPTQTWAATTHVNINYHTYRKAEGAWITQNTWVPCPWFKTYDVVVRSNPHPYGTPTRNSVSLGSSPPGYAVTVNPGGVLPTWMVDILTVIGTGGSFGPFSTPCQ